MDICKELDLDDKFKGRYFVDDIGEKEFKVLFILESPHKNEIQEKTPLAGVSGEIMSEILLKNNKKPLGNLLKEQDSKVINLAIMNICQIPMCLDMYDKEYKGNDELKNINKIKGIPYTDIKEYKDEIKKKEIFAKLNDNFKQRLEKMLEGKKSLLIVVCGVIAQCFFETICENEFQFKGINKCKLFETDCKVIYTIHPSPKTKDKWLDKNDEKLKLILKTMQ